MKDIDNPKQIGDLVEENGCNKWGDGLVHLFRLLRNMQETILNRMDIAKKTKIRTQNVNYREKGENVWGEEILGMVRDKISKHEILWLN